MPAMTRSMRAIPTVLLAAACAGPAADTQSGTAAIPTVDIAATDYGFDAPDTIMAGPTEFRFVNRGTDGHSLAVVRLEDGRTLRQYIDAYREANRTRSPRPTWAEFRGGPASFGLEQGSAVLDLEPGSYAFLCFMPGPTGQSHLLEHEQAHAFVVVPRPADAPAPRAPEADVTVSMLDFSLEVDAPLRAGPQTIRVENVGVEPHHVLIFRLEDGRTLDDYNAWLENGMQDEGVAAFLGGMDVLSQGEEAWFDVDLPPGDYVLVCLVAGQDEVPHVAKGMVRQVRID